MCIKSYTAFIPQVRRIALVHFVHYYNATHVCSFARQHILNGIPYSMVLFRTAIYHSRNITCILIFSTTKSLSGEKYLAKGKIGGSVDTMKQKI